MVSGWAISLKMAIDLVPGFKVLYDSPQARALNLPDAFYGKTKPKGSSTLPKWFSGDLLNWVFAQIRRAHPDESETRLSERLIVSLLPLVAGIRNENERKKKAKTLQNRLAVARKVSG